MNPKNEKHDFYRAEVLPQIVGYREQPHTIEGHIAGQVRRYTPDREDRLADGTIEIVEVKDRFETDKDPEYHAKLDYFAEVYDRLGWSFRLTTQEEIKQAQTFRTVESIQRHRRLSFNAAEVAAVRTVMSEGPARLMDVCSALGPSTVSLPKVCAMMVGRILVLDLASNLEPTSIVKLV